MCSLSTNDLHAKEFQTFTLKKFFGSNTYLMNSQSVAFGDYMRGLRRTNNLFEKVERLHNNLFNDAKKKGKPNIIAHALYKVK